MLLAASWAGCAHENTAVPAAAITPAKITPSPAKAGTPDSLAINPEQIRTDCIAGRRIICGRVLKVLPDGLVVESGYTDLLREPLTQSWVVAGNVSAHRDPALLERNEPGTPCVGLAFLTDISKRKKVKKFDYVIIMGYPAGQYAYAPAPNVKKTIRKFSAGLETAVRLSLEAAEKTTNANAPQVKTNPAQS